MTLRGSLPRPRSSQQTKPMPVGPYVLAESQVSGRRCPGTQGDPSSRSFQGPVAGSGLQDLMGPSCPQTLPSCPRLVCQGRGHRGQELTGDPNLPVGHAVASSGVSKPLFPRLKNGASLAPPQRVGLRVTCAQARAALG